MLVALWAALAAQAAARPGPGRLTTIDGPSPAIVALGGVSVARDGTGALVYLKRVRGVPHVFVSRLLKGSWLPPERVDPHLAGRSSQPVVAAGRGGEVLVAFINGARLYLSRRADSQTSWDPPELLARGAINPSLQMTNFGKAYVAFTALAHGRSSVRLAYFDRFRWALVRGPLNRAADGQAGTGSGRPQVAAAGDGEAVVAWGEQGHIYTRRVWGTIPSALRERADIASLSGWREVSAGNPSLSVGGDSSYVVVGFEETFRSVAGLQTQTRVLTRRLRGSRFEGVTAADGLHTPSRGLPGPGVQSALQPRVTMDEFGLGFATSTRASSGAVYATRLRRNGADGPVSELSGGPNVSAPYATPTVAGAFSDLIVWQQTPRRHAPPEIRGRNALPGFGPRREYVLSSARLGPTDAGDGLAAAADRLGRASVAWVQGAADRLRIVVREVYGTSSPRLAAEGDLYGGDGSGADGASAPSTGLSKAPPASPALSSYSATPPTAGALYSDGPSGRYLLGGRWLYRPDHGDVGVARGWWRDAALTGWSPVAIPNSYNAGQLTPSAQHGYVGWYRRDFTLPRYAFAEYVPHAARRWIVRFESVNYRATVWLNGRLLGSHDGAYLPFEFPLRGLVGGTNRLVVRVDDRRTRLDLPHLPGAGWWNFGGLLREVYLRAVQGVDFERVQVRPLLRCPTCAAEIEEQVVLRNVGSLPQTVRLSGSYGTARLRFGGARIRPGLSWTARASVRIAHPRLWWPGRAALYDARLTLRDGRGRRLGGYFTYSGIRSITVTPDGRLELNGLPLHLRGVDLHEQNLRTGAALSSAQLHKLVGWVRELGATLIRSHYPLNPQIEEMADRDGILIWSEIPLWHSALPYLANPLLVGRAHRMLAENIMVNQNHPSVLLWSVGNELPTPAPPAERRYIASAAAIAHRLDPTRPVGMAISDWPGIGCQSAYAPLDVIGYNDYFGWFGAGDGSTDDRDALSPFLDGLRACYPTKAIMISEFGVEGNRHGPFLERGTYEFQSNAAAFHLHVFAAKPWLSGAIYWLLQDFAGYPGANGGDPWGDPPFIQKGLVGVYGNRKPAFWVVRRIFRSTVQVGR